MKIFKILNTLITKIKNYIIYHPLIIFLIIAIFIYMIPTTFAQLTPINSIEIYSNNLSYQDKEPGSWKVTKRARWISKGKARIIFDIDTFLAKKNVSTDIILVLDTSVSMKDKKLDKVKSDTIELLESLLSNSDNKAALIKFGNTSEILSSFTNNKADLIEKVNLLTNFGSTNYYQALKNVDEILKNYQKEEKRECLVLFLTDGYPNIDIPNEEVQYKYLKSKYPYLEINAIQYEMGQEIVPSIKRISDCQYVADINTLKNVLFEASAIPKKYASFEIVDFINTDYFFIEDEKDIKTSQGNITFDRNLQKVIWSSDVLKSGTKVKIIIDITQKTNIEDNLLPINKKEEIRSQIEDVSDKIVSSETPILKNSYRVLYDGNAPENCVVTGVPELKSYQIYESVELSSAIPKCNGYHFKGWKIVNKEINKINGDFFYMPEEDVTIRAIWSKTTVSKSMNGKVYVAPPAVIQKVTSSYKNELWKYKSTITKIVFRNKISDIEGAIEKFDISQNKDERVLAYIVLNADNATHTAYIEGDGNITANPDSSNMFYQFTKLQEFEGIQLLDTSNVTDMTAMFSKCSSLTTLDLNNFNTQKVTSMKDLFYGSRKLTKLDLSSFNTSRVTNMYSMFLECNSLTELNITSFNTSNVTNMSYMFGFIYNITSLDLRNFNTSKVTDFGYMFYRCTNLSSLNLSSFDTINATNMESMFEFCSKLTTINTSLTLTKVTNTQEMFLGTNILTTTINVKSTVTNYKYMFDSAATTNGAKITVNYTNATSSLVNQMIATKTSDSNVVKGNVI